jgi:hypothetical protein
MSMVVIEQYLAEEEHWSVKEFDECKGIYGSTML